MRTFHERAGLKEYDRSYELSDTPAQAGYMLSTDAPRACLNAIVDSYAILSI